MTAPSPWKRRLPAIALAVSGTAAVVVIALVVAAVVRGNDDDRTAATPTVVAGSTAASGTPSSTPGTSSPASAPPTSQAPSAPPTVTATVTADPAAALDGVARATHSGPVAVPGGGFEAVDVGDGTVRLLRYADGSWSVAGSSTYPRIDGADDPKISGVAVLTGMQHVTAALDGAFSGNGTASVATYTTAGDVGWGIIAASDDGLLRPSGRGATAPTDLGVMYDGGLRNGALRTVDCSRDVPNNAACADPAYQIVKTWTWNGSAFTQASRSGPAQ